MFVRMDICDYIIRRHNKPVTRAVGPIGTKLSAAGARWKILNRDARRLPDSIGRDARTLTTAVSAASPTVGIHRAAIGILDRFQPRL